MTRVSSVDSQDTEGQETVTLVVRAVSDVLGQHHVFLFLCVGRIKSTWSGLDPEATACQSTGSLVTCQKLLWIH